jgi:virginiamycin B lyase
MLSRTDKRLFPRCSSCKSLGMLAAAAAMAIAPALLAQEPATPAAQRPGMPAQSATPNRPPRQPRPKPAGLPSVRREMSSIKPEAIFPVEGSPDWSVITPEATWVASARANHVVQLKAKDNTVGMIVDINRPCAGLTSGFGSIWSPSCGDKKLERIDPSNGKITAAIDAEPENSEGGITMGGGAIWMVVKASPPASAPPAPAAEPGQGGPGRQRGPSLPPSLVKVDPKTNTITARVELPTTAANPVYADGYVWVSTFSNNSVVKVDPKTMTVMETIPTGARPRFITAGAGSVWTLNQGDGTVTKIDTKTSKVTATIQCGLTGSGGDLSYSDGYVWAALFNFPLTKIDAKTDKVIAQWAGPGGDGMRAGGGSVWLSNLQLQTVWRISDKIE